MLASAQAPAQLENAPQTPSDPPAPAAPAPRQAQPTPANPISQHSSAAIAAGLAEDTVQVKVNYSGARVVLFADSAAADQPDTGFAVALLGPAKPATVIRNTPSGTQRFEFVSAPSVFAIGAEPQVAAATSE